MYWKITSFNETDDGRYLIVLNGIVDLKLITRLHLKLFRECEVKYDEYIDDFKNFSEEIESSDLKKYLII